MLKRVITGIILVAVFIPLIILSHTHIFTAVVTLLSLLGVYEMAKCLGFHKNMAVLIPSLLIGAGTPLCTRLLASPTQFAPWALGIILIYLFYLQAYCVIMRDKVDYSLLSRVFMAVVYITAGFCSLILLRDSSGGEYIFLLVFIGAWITDTMAYFTGFLFGKHKLIPEVSPKKTVEGAIGGTLFSGIFYVLYGLVVSKITNIDMQLWSLFVAGIVAAVVAQFGDLVASIIKRQTGIKDFGNIFPGHGGILDRFDSIIALAPFLLMMHAAPFINFII